MEIIAKIIEIVSSKISLPIALFMGVLLFSPIEFLDQIHLKKFVENNLTSIWLFFIFSTILYLYDLTKKIINWSKEKYIKNKKFREAKEYLNSLNSNELAVIYYCLRNFTRTVHATVINSTMVSLVNKGLFYEPFGIYSKMNVPFRIPTQIWKYLLRHKDEFCPKSLLENEDYNYRVNNFIRDLKNVYRD